MYITCMGLSFDEVFDGHITMKARVKSTQKRCKNDIEGAKMTQKVQQTVRKGPNLGEQKPSRGRQEERRKRDREKHRINGDSRILKWRYRII